MAVTVEQMNVILDAKIGPYMAGIAKAQAETNRRAAAIEARYAALSRNIKNSASSAALSIGSAFGGIAGYLGVQQIVEYANAWTRVARSIPASEQAIGTALISASKLTDLANDARVDLDAYAKLYIRTSAAIRDYGYEAGTAERVTSTLSKALKIGGAAASEQASVLLQFSQALNKGKLDGDEFRSVMENAVIVQELLAERLKVSKGEIIKMAAAGKLQIPDLIGALTDGGAKIERIFNSMPATIDEAFTVLRNNLVRYIGNVDEATGASRTFVDLIGAMGRNIDTVANSAAVLAAALLASFGRGVLSGIVAMAARLATIPGLIAGASVAAVSFGSEATLSFTRMNEALRQGATLSEAMQHAMNDTAAGATTVSDQFRGLASVIGDDLMSVVNGISVALTGQSVDWDKLKAAALMAIGSIIGGIKSMVLLVSSSVSVLPTVAELAFKELANRVIRIINWMSETGTAGVNKLYGALNAIPGFNFDLKQADVIGEFDTAELYEKAGALSTAVTQGLTDNFDLTKFAGRVQTEADKIAFDRLTKSWAPGSGFDPKKGTVTTSGTGDTRGRKRFDRDLVKAENNIAAIKAEQQAIGQSAYETERLKIQTDLLNQARESGVKLTDEDRIKIEAISNEMAKATVQTEQMRAAYQQLRDESNQFLSEFIKGIKDGESATDLLANGLNRVADKLIDMATQDLVDAALGGLLGRSSGSQSGGAGFIASGLGKLFGFDGGGYTGSGGKYEPAGVVHKGEYVFNQDAVKRIGLGNLEKLAKGYANGGYVGPSMPVIPKAVAGQSASMANNVSISIDARGATSEGVSKMQSDLIPQIKAIVDERIVRSMSRNATVINKLRGR